MWVNRFYTTLQFDTKDGKTKDECDTIKYQYNNRLYTEDESTEQNGPQEEEIVSPQWTPHMLIQEAIWFGCTAWIETQNESGPITPVTKGNMTEQAILRFLLRQTCGKILEMNKSKVEVLEWREFTSIRGKSTIVLRVDQDQGNLKKGKVYVFTKGSAEKVLEICVKYFENSE